jgi:hypothetical protein
MAVEAAMKLVLGKLKQATRVYQPQSSVGSYGDRLVRAMHGGGTVQGAILVR